MSYHHRWTNGDLISLTPSKIVCIGRNYADHARELNNPIPTEPMLFMKPVTSLVDMSKPIIIDQKKGIVHHELEVSILIGQALTRCAKEQAASAIIGVGIALDLTLRNLQNKLKQKGHPWEKAKAFDGSCPLSAFEPIESFDALDKIELQLTVNGAVRQKGSSRQMLTDIVSLLEYISHWFTLMPGDVVLTGTPAGVGPLHPGDELQIDMPGHLNIRTTVQRSGVE
ncbi:Fumarylacetoacetate hydrolase family protein [Olavius sp. associated proteobacterium Delta 1]|nr:Fumarylacetoacetate hydrolase family protein [Olavius sp. associated proteobacterium Delta 1]